MDKEFKLIFPYDSTYFDAIQDWQFDWKYYKLETFDLFVEKLEKWRFNVSYLNVKQAVFQSEFLIYFLKPRTTLSDYFIGSSFSFWHL